MAAFLYGRGSWGERGSTLMAPPRLPPPTSMEGRLLASISMQETVCARDMGLPENMPRFLASIHALRLMRWPIDQYTRAELGLHGLDDAAYSGRWGLYPATRYWPRVGVFLHDGSPRCWPADHWPDGECIRSGYGSALPGCIHPDLAREFIESTQFLTWRNRVMVEALKGGDR